ncbi:LOW QUALITY PROTEIN: collagen alpha-6(VI) chain-like [Menidia menidia]
MMGGRVLLGVTALLCAAAAQTPECADARLGDIVFLVDGSTSITPAGFQEVRSFLRGFVRSLDIGPGAVRVGLAQYSDQPHAEFLLRDHPTKAALLRAVEEVPHRKGGTQTGRALDFLLGAFFTEEAGSRAAERVPQIAVVLTDGDSFDDVEAPARRLRQHGVLVFAVGVGDYNAEQLELMANHPPERFTSSIDSFDALDALTDSLLETVCVSMQQQMMALADRFADLFFLVDGSLPPKQFNLFRNELLRLIDQTEVGESAYRVGLAQYGQDIQVGFYLNTHATKAQTLKAVKGFKLQAGSGQSDNLGRALQLAPSYFHMDVGGRAHLGARQYLVVVTGKDSEAPLVPIARRVKASGITVVGMSPTLSEEALRRFATDEYVYTNLKVSLLRDVFTSAVGFQSEVQTVTEDCREANVADVVFIVDESGSIGLENFQLVRAFLRSVVSSLEVGPDKVRVAVVTYSDRPTAQAFLSTFRDKWEILQFLSTLPYESGGTRTGAALNFTLSQVLVPGRGAREGVQKVAVVVTDGASQDGVSEAAIALRRAGVTVFAVGIHGANQTELADMASHPSRRHVLSVDSFTELRHLQEVLHKSLCRDILHSAITEEDIKADAQQACEQKDEADIYFLIDDSGSIGNSDFRDMQAFILEFLSTFLIGQNHVRVGLVKYSTAATLEFDLTQHRTAEDAKRAVMGVVHRGGGTNTGRALAFMGPLFREARAGRRAPGYLVVITDGESADPVRRPAENLRAQGVTLFAVGVKQANHSQLTEVAGDPRRVFQVGNFDALKSISSSIISEICASEVCKDVPSDVIFLIDSSEIVSAESFVLLKAFLRSVVLQTLVGPEAVRVGLMQFSSSWRLEWGLGAHRSREAVLAAIEGLRPMGRGVHTGKALAEVARHFEAGRGGRPWLRQVLVLLTAGRAADGVRAPAQRLRDQGVVVYAVGLLEASHSQLLDISGASDHVFSRRDFRDLKDLDTSLALKFCDPRRDCKRIDKADILFLVDGSSSIDAEKFQSMKTFMGAVVNLTTVGRDLTRFGAILYADRPESRFELGDFESRGQVLAAIEGLAAPGGDTYTAAALTQALQYLGRPHGGRGGGGVPQLLMVITDGDATDAPRLRAAAEALRGAGVRVVSIGVRDADQGQLLLMAGDPGRVFYVNEFRQLELLHRNISHVLCNYTKQECDRTDVVFFLDYPSGLSAPDHGFLLNFTAEVLARLDVGPDAVRVGLAQSGSAPVHEFYLSTYLSTQEALDHVLGLRRLGGAPLLGRALEFLKDYFRSGRGGRGGVAQRLVLVTEGRSQDAAAPAARALRRMGVDVLVVSVGTTVDMQLLQVAGDPRNLFRAPQYADLNSLRTRVLQGICKDSGDISTDCSVDIAVGFDLSLAPFPGERLSRRVSRLEEVVRLLTPVPDLCCSTPAPPPARLLPIGRRRPLPPGLPVRRLQPRGPAEGPGPELDPQPLQLRMLGFYRDLFRTKAQSKTKVLLIFSDGLDEDVMTLEQESEKLRSSGVSALLTVALDGADPKQLHMVEFGRGFMNQQPFSIQMQNLGTAIQQQMSSVVDRVCCGVLCKCRGHEGPRGDFGNIGIKGLPGLKGHRGFTGDEGTPVSAPPPKGRLGQEGGHGRTSGNIRLGPGAAASTPPPSDPPSTQT